MRRLLLLATAVLGGLTVPDTGWAQWTSNQIQVHGMFGDRTLGEPLRAGERRFGGGILRGPNGMFLGRDPNHRGSLFRAYTPPAVPTPAAPPSAPAPAVTPVEQPPAAAPAEAIPAGQAPEIWFRSPGEASAPAPTAATPVSVAAPRPVAARTIGLQIGFPPAGVQPTRLGADLAERITRMAGPHADSPLAISINGGTATVRGQVKTPYDRAVIGALLLMEPGIQRLRNELTVQGAPSLASESAGRTGQP